MARGCHRLGCGLGKTLAVRCGIVNWCVILCHFVIRKPHPRKSIGTHSHQSTSLRSTKLAGLTTESDFSPLSLWKNNTFVFILLKDSRSQLCWDYRIRLSSQRTSGLNDVEPLNCDRCTHIFLDIPMSEHDTPPPRLFLFSFYGKRRSETLVS